MKKNNTYKLALFSLITALSVVLGFFFKIPTGTGFATLLDVGIFFTAFYFGSKEGAAVGALSAFLLDLISGYPQWMLFSLVIHGLQGYFAGFKGKSQYLGLFLATLVMVGGYAAADSLWFNSGTALLDMVSNLAQNMLGMVLGFLLAKWLPKNFAK